MVWKKNIKVFLDMQGHPEGRGRATPIFEKSEDSHLFKIPVALSSLWPRKIFENFPGMLGLPEGRGKATPIFGKKFNFGPLFSKLCLHRVPYQLWPRKIILKLFRHIRSTWGAWQGHTHFEQKLKLEIFIKTPFPSDSLCSYCSK